jgi:hypothetical protein
MLRSVYLEVLALDGNPFDFSMLNNFQRTNWLLFFDELSTLSSNMYSKEAVNYKFWKLCSGDIPFNNQVEKISWEPLINAESSVPMLAYNTDSLPISLHMFHSHCEFPHPEIMIFDRGEEEYPSCPFCGLPAAFYEDEKLSPFWNCDVREDARWTVSPKEFKKGRKTIYNKANYTEQHITWYETGALKSIKQNIGGDVKEMKWTEAGQPLYLKWQYNYSIHAKEYKEYTETAWDTNGNMLWCRIYTKNRIAELRFYPDGHIKAKGWVVEGKPIGTWYFFDVAGNAITGNAPDPLKID